MNTGTLRSAQTWTVDMICGGHEGSQAVKGCVGDLPREVSLTARSARYVAGIVQGSMRDGGDNGLSGHAWAAWGELALLPMYYRPSQPIPLALPCEEPSRATAGQASKQLRTPGSRGFANGGED